MVQTRSRLQDKAITTIGAATRKMETTAVADSAMEVRTSIKTSQVVTVEEVETAREATKDPSRDSTVLEIIKTKVAKIVCSRSMAGKKVATDIQVVKVGTEDQTERAWIEAVAETRAETKDPKVKWHLLLATQSGNTQQTPTPMAASAPIPHLRDSILALVEVVAQAASQLAVNLLMPAAAVCQ